MDWYVSLMFSINVLMELAASSDETVQVTYYPPPPSVTKPVPPLIHPLAVRAVLPLGLTSFAEPYVVTAYGDIIQLHDVTSVFESEVVGEIGAHWHDVTAIRLWLRTSRNESGNTRIEPFIVSTSLDGTIRKWRFNGAFTILISIIFVTVSRSTGYVNARKSSQPNTTCCDFFNP